MFARFIDMLSWTTCKHENIVGIYGDAINFMPKNRRLLCIDCGSAIDGPVSLAETPKTSENKEK